MATLYEALRADIVTAIKAREAGKLLALRTMDAAVQRAALDQGKPIDDALVVATVRKAVKNLSDAKAEFLQGGRADLVAANEVEIGLLSAYLPQGLGSEQLDTLIAEAIRSTGAQSRKEMGKVLAVLKGRPEAGLIDFAEASRRVQARLA